MKSPSRACLVALCLAALGPFVSGGNPREVAASGNPEVRSEYFAMRPLGATPEADPSAVVAWKRSVRKGGWMLESEALFGEGELRVLHTENMAQAKPRLVWRELGSSGRTWMAEWTPASGLLESLEFSVAEDVHGEKQVGEVRFPLDLVESCRTTEPDAETLQLVSPTRAGVVEARMVVQDGLPADLPDWSKSGLSSLDEGSLRWIQVLTQDGSQLAAYLFHGEALMGFQWASGTPWALPISEAEWESKAAAWQAAQQR